jgi:multiple sugar transport system permease protein
MTDRLNVMPVGSTGRVLKQHLWRATLLRETTLIYSLVIVVSIATLGPLLWLLLTSLKTVLEADRIPPTFFPLYPTLQPYRFVLTENPQVHFVRYLSNSLLVGVIAIVCTMGLASLASFGLAFLNVPFKRFLSLFILATYLFPGPTIIIPIFEIIQSLHLLDNLAALMLLNTVFSLPFSVWMLTGYFRKVPRDLFESARIDGCSSIRILWSVIMPISRPGLTAVAIFSFLMAWNQFLFALLILTSELKYTLTLGLVRYIGQYHTYYSYLSAASIIAIVPVTILFVLFSRQIVQGLASGAVKG